MKSVLLKSSVLVVLVLGVAAFWLKSQMAHTPWEFEPFEKDGHVLFKPDLNLGKDHIYTEQENEAIFKKVSPVKHMTDTRLGFSALNGVLAYHNQVDVGQLAPDFELTTTDGKAVSLSELRGKIVVFMFVAMSCPPAREQVPRFDALKDKYNSEEVEFLAIYSRERHAGEKGYPDIQFAESEEQKYRNARMLSELTELTIAVDGMDENALNSYGRVPNSSYVIDERGVIVFRSTWADSKKVEAIVDYLLTSQKSSKVPS